MGEIINAYTILVGKPDGKKSLGRAKRKWENIKMDLKLDSLIRKRPVEGSYDTIMNLRIQQKSGNFLSFKKDSAPLSYL
jgi:hypothetical protein